MDEFQNRFIILTLLLIFALLINLIPAISADTLNSTQTIRDGETLVSSGGVFELGFFSLGNSSNRYVGIWYKNISIRTYVWVANREAPLTTNSGVLRVTEPGVLALFRGANDSVSVWSTNTTISVANPAAQLFDSGNLVVKEANDDRPENFVWQSFIYPTDTFLPGIRLGRNFETGVETYFTSWRTEDDPARGEYSIHTDPTGYPQLIIRKGDVVQTRLGPWNGLRWSGAPDTSNDPTYQVMLIMNENEVKYTEIYSPSIVSNIRLIPRGSGQRSTWSYRTNTWTQYFTMPVDNCDSYSICGAYGSCTVGNSPNCACLDRFVPRDPVGWNRTDWSGGCIRRTELNCSEDVFLRYSDIRLPDSTNSSFNDQITRLGDCEAECKRNCSCVAYTQLNISGSGSGCLFYHGDLFDIRTMAQAGQDLYIRMAASESPPKSNDGSSKRVTLIVSITSAVGVSILCLILGLVLIRKRKKERIFEAEVAGPVSGTRVVTDSDLPFFSLSAILQATNNFSNSNKLGEGGFGPVYRGMLEDGQQIAVKRLSKTSSQGVDELKNEVLLIAKLQHRNLVRTLGCCVEGEENMLIYEYMPNNSLDLIIFDKTKSILLDWQMRFQIINGIAKGLLYLHQDSRLRIIHRDLKASNILLDDDMNPKISDFGLARSFGGNETEAQTRRVVGTYGYMSPEYAIDGLFSIKSDVFSFGVLVLEIVSGKRNRGFSLNEYNLNLLGHAWTLYREGIPTELVDPCLGDSFDLSQVVRSIHVGLLCVQQSAEDRPNMSSVVFMLGNDFALPQAKQPGFFTERDVLSDKVYSENQVTITWTQGR